MKKIVTKVTENRDTRTVEEHINFAADAAQEAYDALDGDDERHRHIAAREAYRSCMPLLETKESVKAFIACVAQGVHYQFIKPEEARLLLYGAQVWLQVEAGKVAA
jgi:small ligand-binding sensory domain FIST